MNEFTKGGGLSCEGASRADVRGHLATEETGETGLPLRSNNQLPRAPSLVERGGASPAEDHSPSVGGGFILRCS